MTVKIYSLPSQKKVILQLVIRFIVRIDRVNKQRHTFKKIGGGGGGGGGGGYVLGPTFVVFV